MNKSPSLSKRIVGWTTNLLATGLIALSGLVVGRQVLEWWQAESVVPTAVGVRVGSAAPGGGVSFGESPAQFRRWQVHGDTSAVLGELRNACRAAASASPEPLGKPTAAEQQLLAQVAGLQPREHVPEKFRLFELAKPWPIVVAITDRPQERDSNSAHVVVAQNGVLSWGLAFPASTEKDEWMLFSFAPAASDLAFAADMVTLPASCQRLIAIPSGDLLLVGFASSIAAKDLADEWDVTTSGGSWRADEDWQVTGNKWHRRYACDAATLDVQFATSGSGETIGFAAASSRGGK